MNIFISIDLVCNQINTTTTTTKHKQKQLFSE